MDVTHRFETNAPDDETLRRLGIDPETAEAVVLVRGDRPGEPGS